MKLVVGLGNPGPRYAKNRHNVGFRCLSHLARAHSLAFDGKGGHARLATSRLAGHEVVLAKPQTFMNLSGKSVAALRARYRLSLEDMLVVHDDVDLPLGRLRIRPRGGAGGHRGVESIIQAVGSQEFARLRVGIGRPPLMGEEGLRDYVLSDFTPEETAALNELLPRVAEAILCVLEEGVEAAMNRFNM